MRLVEVEPGREQGMSLKKLRMEELVVQILRKERGAIDRDALSIKEDVTRLVTSSLMLLFNFHNKYWIYS